LACPTQAGRQVSIDLEQSRRTVHSAVELNQNQAYYIFHLKPLGFFVRIIPSMIY
jgi:hypothetical protein